VFYIGIFVLNGMSGVLSKIFTSSVLPKASAAGYSVWCAAATVTLSGVAWLVLSLLEKKQSTDAPEPSRKALWQSYGIGALYGSINKVANFILVIALLHVDASVQYPMVTGGTMIVSSVLSFWGDKKTDRRELFSVALAFLGMVALFAIPI